MSGFDTFVPLRSLVHSRFSHRAVSLVLLSLILFLKDWCPVFKSLKVLCGAAAVSGSVLMTTTIAYASTDNPVDISTGDSASSSSAPLGSLSRSRSVTVQQAEAAAAAAPNPYGCYGQTDNPHFSSGQASVHGRTRCAVSVGGLSVHTDLYRSRWYEPQHLASGDSSRNFGVDSQDATPHWPCSGTGTYTYEGDSSHEAADGAQTYYAYTSRTGRFGC